MIEPLKQWSAQGCDIIVADVTPLASPEALEHALEILSPSRRNKTLAYKNQRSRMLSAGVGLLLDMMLQPLGLRERDMTYIEGEHGKPALAQYPGIHFNLSHSGTLVACGVGNAPLGVDVQCFVTPKDSLMRLTLNDLELAQINGLSDPEAKKRHFTTLWTLKESYVKATGRGLTRTFPSFNPQGIPAAKLNPPAVFSTVELDDAVVSAAILQPTQ